MLPIPPVNIPEGQSGPWKVKKFTIDAEEARRNRARAANPSSMGRWVPEGTYTALYRDGSVIMSDTPDEMRDHYAPVRAAKGHCLVFGLGIGMVAAAMLEKPEVTKVTVVELSEDVIALTGPTLQERYGDRLEIIQADALTWQPPKGVRYAVVWADIWDHISGDNLTEMTTLKRRYARRADWKGCWAEEECKLHLQRYNRGRRYA